MGVRPVGVAGPDSVAALGQRNEGEVTVRRPADDASTLVLRASEDLGVCEFSQRAMRRCCGDPVASRHALDGENGLGREFAQDPQYDGVASRCGRSQRVIPAVRDEVGERLLV